MLCIAIEDSGDAWDKCGDAGDGRLRRQQGLSALINHQASRARDPRKLSIHIQLRNAPVNMVDFTWI